VGRPPFQSSIGSIATEGTVVSNHAKAFMGPQRAVTMHPSMDGTISQMTYGRFDGFIGLASDYS
jgi:hypothetical protein